MLWELGVHLCLHLRPISVLRFWILEGFDSSIILSLRGEIIMCIGNFPEMVSQQILAGIILVERLGILSALAGKAAASGSGCGQRWRTSPDRASTLIVLTPEDVHGICSPQKQACMRAPTPNYNIMACMECDDVEWNDQMRMPVHSWTSCITCRYPFVSSGLTTKTSYYGLCGKDFATAGNLIVLTSSFMV